MEPIKAKIIRILSPTRMVISKGAVDGVRKDMEFVIYTEGESLEDPETHELLERMEIIKGHLYVHHVQERVAIATTTPPHSNNGAMHTPPSTDAAPNSNHELPVDAQQVEPLGDVDLTVHKGDNVRNTLS